MEIYEQLVEVDPPGRVQFSDGLARLLQNCKITFCYGVRTVLPNYTRNLVVYSAGGIHFYSFFISFISRGKWKKCFIHLQLISPSICNVIQVINPNTNTTQQE